MSNAFYSLPRKVLTQYGVSANGQSWLNLHNDGDFHPNLGLHFAALTGNLALVKFALQHGQPTTSLLNGLLPLHAACSGGDDSTVAYLISQGADVNAARLRAPNGGSPGIGTEGSLALHFAAANGHSTVVRMLLEHGAHAAALDGDGFTPEQLASSNGHVETALVIRMWLQTQSSKYRSASSKSSNMSIGYGFASVSSISSASQNDTGRSPFPSLRGQRSLDQLSLAAAGLKASFRNTRRQALAKVSSNPNLKSTSIIHSAHDSIPAVPLVPAALNGGCESGARCFEPPPRISSTDDRSGLYDISCDRPSRRRPSLPLLFHRQAPAIHSEQTTDIERTDSSVQALSPFKRNLTESLPKGDIIRSSPHFPVRKPEGGVLIETSVHRTSSRASPSSDAIPLDDSDSLSSSSFFSTSSNRQLVDFTFSSPPLSIPQSSSLFVEPDTDDPISAGSKILSGGSPSKEKHALQNRQSCSGRSEDENADRSPQAHVVQDNQDMLQVVHLGDVGRDLGDDWQEYLADVQPRPAGLRKMQSSQRGAQRTSNSVRQIMTYEGAVGANNDSSSAITSAIPSNTSTRPNSSRSSGVGRTDASSSSFGLGRMVPYVSAERVDSSKSLASFQSFDGAVWTASECADVIMRSVEGDTVALAADGTPYTLTQMLAAYGEALARERKKAGTLPTFKRQLSDSSIEGLGRKQSQSSFSEERRNARTRLYRQYSCPMVPKIISTRQSPSNLGVLNPSSSPMPKDVPSARSRSPIRADVKVVEQVSRKVGENTETADGRIGYNLCEDSLAEMADGFAESAGESQAMQLSSSNATLFNELRPGDWEGDVGKLSYIIKNCSMSSPSKNLPITGSSIARRSWCADEEGRDRSSLPPVGSELLHKHSPSLPVSLSHFAPSIARTSTSTSPSTDVAQTRASTDQLWKGERRRHPTHAHKRNGAQIFTGAVIPSPLGDSSRSDTHCVRAPCEKTQIGDRKDQAGRAALTEACLHGGAKPRKTGVMKALFSGLKGA